MDESSFNMAVRKFLKEVGVTSQREIERIVREGKVEGDKLKLRMTLTAENTPLNHIVEAIIHLNWPDPPASETKAGPVRRWVHWVQRRKDGGSLQEPAGLRRPGFRGHTRAIGVRTAGHFSRHLRMKAFRFPLVKEVARFVWPVFRFDKWNATGFRRRDLRQPIEIGLIGRLKVKAGPEIWGEACCKQGKLTGSLYGRSKPSLNKSDSECSARGGMGEKLNW
jgi:hypothetical protein